MDFPDLTPELVNIGSSLAKVSATNGASIVAEKIRSIKTSNRSEATISGLEELVQDLVNEKAELVRIAQSYKQELTNKGLTAGDVQYISSEIIPLIESFIDDESEDAESQRKMIEKIEPVLSIQTINILQLLGFDFKKAVGEPLTRLCESLISKPTYKSDDLLLKELEHKNLQIQIAQNPEAFERFKVLRGVSWD